MTGTRSAAFEAWSAQARAVQVEDEIARRGIKLKRTGMEHVGPCPKCGGEDRFAVNVAKQVFRCRGCDIGGDVIKLVEHLDGVDFIAACTALTGGPPPKANGLDRTGEPRKIVAAGLHFACTGGSPSIGGGWPRLGTIAIERARLEHLGACRAFPRRLGVMSAGDERERGGDAMNPIESVAVPPGVRCVVRNHV
jgi:hypothetical protein